MIQELNAEFVKLDDFFDLDSLTDKLRKFEESGKNIILSASFADGLTWVAGIMKPSLALLTFNLVLRFTFLIIASAPDK